ncbi:MAG: TusE/DsrC/DsvC family sulfur relay protein [Candidatus Aminicenantes bacterium]|nr:TusE/DsrC/DsvC family sulfur relay protein [Candidatus Aminicenantes bacterium]
MSQKEVAGVTIDIDDNGYMTNFEQWSKDVAVVLAKENGIDELTPKHWEVIDYIQKEVKDGSVLSIRKVGKSGVVDIKAFYDLFPDGPLKKATLISGVPKPSGCV